MPRLKKPPFIAPSDDPLGSLGLELPSPHPEDAGAIIDTTFEGAKLIPQLTPTPLDDLLPALGAVGRYIDLTKINKWLQGRGLKFELPSNMVHRESAFEKAQRERARGMNVGREEALAPELAGAAALAIPGGRVPSLKVQAGHKALSGKGSGHISRAKISLDQAQLLRNHAFAAPNRTEAFEGTFKYAVARGWVEDTARGRQKIRDILKGDSHVSPTMKLRKDIRGEE